MDRVEIRHDVVVPETQHAKSLRLQIGVTFLIRHRFGMLSAINFYDQAGFEADKVDDVMINGFLASETTTVFAVTQNAP